jgi:hypothetical protein
VRRRHDLHALSRENGVCGAAGRVLRIGDMRRWNAVSSKREWPVSLHGRDARRSASGASVRAARATTIRGTARRTTADSANGDDDCRTTGTSADGFDGR